MYTYKKSRQTIAHDIYKASRALKPGEETTWYQTIYQDRPIGRLTITVFFDCALLDFTLSGQPNQFYGIDLADRNAIDIIRAFDDVSSKALGHTSAS